MLSVPEILFHKVCYVSHAMYNVCLANKYSYTLVRLSQQKQLLCISLAAERLSLECNQYIPKCQHTEYWEAMEIQQHAPDTELSQ